MSEDRNDAAEMPELEEGQHMIEAGMDNLERNIRELHDRLTPVMTPPVDNKEDGSKPDRSPMAERISLMNELITDIHHRLEL